MKHKYAVGDSVHLKYGYNVKIISLTSWHSAALNLELPKYIVRTWCGPHLDTTEIEIHEHEIG